MSSSWEAQALLQAPKESPLAGLVASRGEVEENPLPTPTVQWPLPEQQLSTTAVLPPGTGTGQINTTRNFFEQKNFQKLSQNQPQLQASDEINHNYNNGLMETSSHRQSPVVSTYIGMFSLIVNIFLYTEYNGGYY